MGSVMHRRVGVGLGVGDGVEEGLLDGLGDALGRGDGDGVLDDPPPLAAARSVGSLLLASTAWMNCSRRMMRTASSSRC